MPVEWYAAKLDSLGFKEQKVLLRVYTHYLPSRAEVVEWVKGTYLTDYQVRMTPESFANYLERYRELLMPRLSDARPFFYAYKRILLWGRKS